MKDHQIVNTLKPCPICGSKAILRRVDEKAYNEQTGEYEYWPAEGALYSVECSNDDGCLQQTTQYYIEADTIADWNKRVESHETQNELLPCPFDGMPVELKKHTLHVYGRKKDDSSYYVRCPRCGVEHLAKGSFDKANVIRLWNSRKKAEL